MASEAQALSHSLNSLYNQYRGWLHAWLLRRLSCHNDADDLTQDTFVQIIRSRKVNQIESPKSYLATIARGLSINLFRRRAIEQAYLDEIAQLPEKLASSPEQHQEAIETLIAIDLCLDGMPAKVREAFMLSKLEGLTYKQIASRLLVTERSVKNYMAQAMLSCLLAAQYPSL